MLNKHSTMLAQFWLVNFQNTRTMLDIMEHYKKRSKDILWNSLRNISPNCELNSIKSIWSKSSILNVFLFLVSKCFSKYQLATILPTIAISNNYHYLNRKGDGVCSPFYSQNYECLPHQRSKYRTIDGTCNNLRHPYWGRSFTCHVRILPPDYSDGIQAFRMSKAGRPLPNPRTLSNYIAESKDMKAFYTGLILGWGQFINHDITNTEGHLATPFPNTRVDCCVQHSDKCAAIPLDNANDYLLNTHKTRCFNFIRSSPCPLCKFGSKLS